MTDPEATIHLHSCLASDNSHANANGNGGSSGGPTLSRAPGSRPSF